MRNRNEGHLLPRREKVSPLEHAVPLDSKTQRANRWKRLIRHWAKALLPAAFPFVDDLRNTRLRLSHPVVIASSRKAVMTTRITTLQQNHRDQSRSTCTSTF